MEDDGLMATPWLNEEELALIRTLETDDPLSPLPEALRVAPSHQAHPPLNQGLTPAVGPVSPLDIDINRLQILSPNWTHSPAPGVDGAGGAGAAAISENAPTSWGHGPRETGRDWSMGEGPPAPTSCPMPYGGDSHQWWSPSPSQAVPTVESSAGNTGDPLSAATTAATAATTPPGIAPSPARSSTRSIPDRLTALRPLAVSWHGAAQLPSPPPNGGGAWPADTPYSGGLGTGAGTGGPISPVSANPGALGPFAWQATPSGPGPASGQAPTPCSDGAQGHGSCQAHAPPASHHPSPNHHTAAHQQGCPLAPAPQLQGAAVGLPAPSLPGAGPPASGRCTQGGAHRPAPVAAQPVDVPMHPDPPVFHAPPGPSGGAAPACGVHDLWNEWAGEVAGASGSAAPHHTHAHAHAPAQQPSPPQAQPQPQVLPQLQPPQAFQGQAGPSRTPSQTLSHSQGHPFALSPGQSLGQGYSPSASPSPGQRQSLQGYAPCPSPSQGQGQSPGQGQGQGQGQGLGQPYFVGRSQSETLSHSRSAGPGISLSQGAGMARALGGTQALAPPGTGGAGGGRMIGGGPPSGGVGSWLSPAADSPQGSPAAAGESWQAQAQAYGAAGAYPPGQHQQPPPPRPAGVLHSAHLAARLLVSPLERVASEGRLETASLGAGSGASSTGDLGLGSLAVTSPAVMSSGRLLAGSMPGSISHSAAQSDEGGSGPQSSAGTPPHRALHRSGSCPASPPLKRPLAASAASSAAPSDGGSWEEGARLLLPARHAAPSRLRTSSVPGVQDVRAAAAAGGVARLASTSVMGLMSSQGARLAATSGTGGRPSAVSLAADSEACHRASSAPTSARRPRPSPHPNAYLQPPARPQCRPGAAAPRMRSSYDGGGPLTGADGSCGGSGAGATELGRRQEAPVPRSSASREWERQQHLELQQHLQMQEQVKQAAVAAVAAAASQAAAAAAAQAAAAEQEPKKRRVLAGVPHVSVPQLEYAGDGDGASGGAQPSAARLARSRTVATIDLGRRGPHQPQPLSPAFQGPQPISPREFRRQASDPSRLSVPCGGPGTAGAPSPRSAWRPSDSPLGTRRGQGSGPSSGGPGLTWADEAAARGPCGPDGAPLQLAGMLNVSAVCRPPGPDGAQTGPDGVPPGPSSVPRQVRSQEQVLERERDVVRERERERRRMLLVQALQGREPGPRRDAELEWSPAPAFVPASASSHGSGGAGAGSAGGAGGWHQRQGLQPHPHGSGPSQAFTQGQGQALGFQAQAVQAVQARTEVAREQHQDQRLHQAQAQAHAQAQAQYASRQLNPPPPQVQAQAQAQLQAHAMLQAQRQALLQAPGQMQHPARDRAGQLPSPHQAQAQAQPQGRAQEWQPQAQAQSDRQQPPQYSPPAQAQAQWQQHELQPHPYSQHQQQQQRQQQQQQQQQQPHPQQQGQPQYYPQQQQQPLQGQMRQGYPSTSAPPHQSAPHQSAPHQSAPAAQPSAQQSHSPPPAVRPQSSQAYGAGAAAPQQVQGQEYPQWHAQVRAQPTAFDRAQGQAQAQAPQDVYPLQQHEPRGLRQPPQQPQGPQLGQPRAPRQASAQWDPTGYSGGPSAGAPASPFTARTQGGMELAQGQRQAQGQGQPGPGAYGAPPYAAAPHPHAYQRQPSQQAPQQSVMLEPGRWASGVSVGQGSGGADGRGGWGSA